MPANIAVLAGALVVAIALATPRVRRSRVWAATVTPLASIIGSGFLVSGPLLASVAGAYSVFLMAALCAAAYIIGSAIRFNIIHVEPRLDGEHPDTLLLFIERTASLCLAISYLISICFYVQLLSAFVLRGLETDGTQLANLLSTVILSFLGATGFLRGFRNLERLEELAVTVKLALIAGLLIGFVHFNLEAALDGSWRIPSDGLRIDFQSLRVSLGALLIIQGFETSRYLGHVYGPQERVRSMRYAQWIATAIYLAFISLAVTFLDPTVPAVETAIIDYSGKIATILPILLILGAVSAQFSAATADFVAATGILVQSIYNLQEKWIYPLIAIFTVWLTWEANVFEILTLASRGFAAYYLLQCLQAVIVASRSGSEPRDLFRIGTFVLGTVVSAAVLILGIPAH